MSRDLSTLRQEYVAGGLSEADLAPEPVATFRHWLHDAVSAGLHEPNAMVVSSVSAAGVPSSRMVLLKGVDQRGFVFFTNYGSRKGGDQRQRTLCFLTAGRRILVLRSARRTDHVLLHVDHE